MSWTIAALVVAALLLVGVAAIIGLVVAIAVWWIDEQIGDESERDY
jgi:hypothetical protein